MFDQKGNPLVIEEFLVSEAKSLDVGFSYNELAGIDSKEVRKK